MSPTTLAYALLAFCPFFMASNIIIGAVAVRTVEPFTLTFLRWGLAFLIILPFAWRAMIKSRETLIRQWRLVLLNSFLLMVPCGAGVYWSLKYTSATNGTLIYTATPVLIIVMEWLFRGRAISTREIIGILFAMCGILCIIFKGSLAVMMDVQFNAGDLLFVVAASGFAIYSVVSKSKALQPVPMVGMFAVVAVVGALMQIPVMAFELVEYGFPQALDQWLSIGGLALVASVLAFITYQYGILVLGPSTAGMVMYLLPPVGVLLAVVFLGEDFKTFHLFGLVLVMSGIILATFPRRYLPQMFTGSKVS
ncbi:EamA domain-containing membrane protein RarD [Cohaesibacter sp. ES.047]|uniref:DMT family transporter n=1 Tax=Cohaesibacter sp. ES.047 TaxID=1798205 RepID=UPI000BC0E251|nr:DMT family transporter [Cohaesibacter sp. ES.047]SNY93317.1 EamA domain-containing membrane protein RarD [Cohaesibacter sp. ES.047]